jgi:hypothetical protein
MIHFDYTDSSRVDYTDSSNVYKECAAVDCTSYLIPSRFMKGEKYGDRIVGAEGAVSKLLYSNDYPSIKHEITPIIPGLLYLGGVNDINKAIAIYGITHVLNCAKESHIKRKRIPESIVLSTIGAEDDTDYPIIDLHLDYCIKFINQSIIDGGKVFIHCKSGINRSVTLAIGYCMKILCEDYVGCVRRINEMRPGILRNKSFVRQLNKLYRILTDS